MPMHRNFRQLVLNSNRKRVFYVGPGFAVERSRARGQPCHTNGQGEQAGPPLSARALAIVHLAIYDAFAHFNNDPALPPYIRRLTIQDGGRIRRGPSNPLGRESTCTRRSF